MSALDFEKIDTHEIHERLSACIKEAEKKLAALHQHSENFHAQMDIFMLSEELIGAGFRMENITISTLTMQGEPWSTPVYQVKVAVDAGKGHGWIYAAN